MFNAFSIEDSDLDTAISAVYRDLQMCDSHDQNYQKSVDQLVKLYALKNQTVQLNLQTQQSAAAQQLANDQNAWQKEQSAAAQQLANDQNAWQEEQDSRPFYERVDPNTILNVLGNLVVAVIVVKYEQTGVIGSKVLSFMRKF